jgi:serine/threonine protein kinase
MFTVVYASPEQLTNKPVDSLSDLFSLGVVMYEKLTGKLPFKGTKAMEIFVEQTKWKFPHPRQLNPNIPKKLEQIILKLLTKDPTYRYPTADMVIGELDRLLEVTILGQNGLTLSNIISDIKGLTTETEKKGFKKRTIYDEQILLKKQRAELLDARQKLRIEMSRNLPDNSKIDSYKELCDTLQEEYNRTESQIKMVLGFKSEPLVIDKFNTIFKLETIAFEKRGIPFTINTLEQKLTNTDGEEIIVGSINFTEKAKRIFTNKQNTSSLSTEGNQWYFSSFEEKELPILLLVGNQDMPTPPQGFKGFFWPKEFLIAIKKLNWTGVSISETFKGIDRSGREVYAEHKETIFFSQSLLDQI